MGTSVHHSLESQVEIIKIALAILGPVLILDGNHIFGEIVRERGFAEKDWQDILIHLQGISQFLTKPVIFRAECRVYCPVKSM